MATSAAAWGTRDAANAPHRPLVRKPLLAALALSVLLHIAWTFWPVDTDTEPETAVLTATLTEIPPPPVPSVEPAVTPKPVEKAKRPRTTPRRPAPATPATITAPDTSTAAPAQVASTGNEEAAPPAQAAAAAAPAPANDSGASLAKVPPPVVLPPRVDLAYKVFLGTQGFMIGDATYRFEHAGDRYRISTVGQARGLAALLMRGRGKIESRGRITPNGLQPYEFSIERGSADRREVAFFDWDAGNVVLHDGARAQLEPPAFDPLTILWQPYFSPPGKGEQTFSVATTRRVARYTLTLQGEESIAWQHGEILTERWHRRSDDGNTDAWMWLAPSMHYIPVKMRVTRTSRGTLEVLLDSIRVDDDPASAFSADSTNDAVATGVEPTDATPSTASDIMYGMPGSALPPMRAEDLRGQ